MTINIQFFIYTLLIISLAGLCVISIRQWKQKKQELSATKALLNQARNDINSTNNRLNVVFQISQKFVEAEREGEIVNELLALSMDITGAMGASFVPFDNHGQPLAANRVGDFPFPVPDAWLEYLASPIVRSDCMNCTRHEAIGTTCPLLKGPFSDALGLYCLPLRRGEREFGILNLYMPDTYGLDESTRAFIGSLLDATALAIDGIRLRESEHETLNHLRSVQQQADSKILLHELLDNACAKLMSDFGLLIPDQIAHVNEHSFYPQGEILISGDIPSSIIMKLDDVLQRIVATGEEISDKFELNHGNGGSRVFHVLGMPVITFNKIQKGVILLGREGEEAFQPQYFPLLRTLSSQIGLVFHVTDQLSEITYKAMVDERIRLAREIHDGLAQTLGYLKLLVAQMQDYIDQRDYDRLNRAAHTCSQTISGAYHDVREAIDGLRVLPEDKNGRANSDPSVWLEQTISEFQDNQNIYSFNISLEKYEFDINLSAEIQAQLIRIIQEALSNVRKHANANQVDISFRENDGDLILEIRDNGSGFSLEEVPGPSQHGLKGMRERSELIGADFQVISLAGIGTTVRIRLPHSMYRQLEKNR